MRAYSLFLIFFLLPVSLAYSFTCNPDPTNGDDGVCDVALQIDPVVTLTVNCDPDWSDGGSYSCSGSVAGNLCLEEIDGDVSVANANLCNFYSAGSVRDGYCFSKAGSCPVGEGYSELGDECLLTVYNSATYEAKTYSTTRSYRFTQSFPKRDDSFISPVDSSVIYCSDSYNDYFDSLGVVSDDLIVSSPPSTNWCSNNDFVFRIGDSVFGCFRLDCNPNNGWELINGGLINCDPDKSSLNNYCVPSDNSGACFYGLKCSDNSVLYSADYDSSPRVDGGACFYNAVCGSDGFVFSSSTTIYLSDGSTLDSGVSDLLSDDFVRVGDDCVHGLECLDSNDNFGGGWFAMIDYCPLPGTVGSIGGVSVCFYTDTAGDSCSASGCNNKFALMIGDPSIYECTPSGLTINVPEVAPPSVSLQSVNSLLSFGYQDVAHLSGKPFSGVTDCSCSAQFYAGGEQCSGGLYGSGLSTINLAALAGSYNPALPVSSASGIGEPVCDCDFPDKALLVDSRWNGDRSFFVNNSACERLGLGECFWGYNHQPQSLSGEQGSDLSSLDYWCTDSGEGSACNYVVNSFNDFLFNVSTLVDLRVTLFNPNRSVPVFVSSFGSGLKVESSTTPINSLTSSSGASLIVDSSPSLYDSASLSFYCYPAGRSFSLFFNDYSHSVVCDGWTSVDVTGEVVKDDNVISVSGVSLGSGGPGSFSAPVSLGVSGPFFVVGNRLLVFSDGSLIDPVNGVSSVIDFVPDDLAFIGGDLFALSGGEVSLFSLSGDKWIGTEKSFDFNNGFIASDGSFLFLINDSLIEVLDPDFRVVAVKPLSCGSVSDVSDSNGLVLFACGDLLLSARLVGGSVVTSSLTSFSGELFAGDYDFDGVTDLVNVDSVGARLLRVNPAGFVSVSGLPELAGASAVLFGDFGLINRPLFVFERSGSWFFLLNDEAEPLVFNPLFAGASINSLFFNDSSGSVFSLSGLSSDGTPFFSLLLSGDSFAAPDLLFPNVHGLLTGVSYDSGLGFSYAPVVGSALICGSSPVFSVKFVSDEERVSYDSFNLSVRFNGAPVSCSLVDGSPLTGLVFGDDAYEVVCDLPPCSRGLPLLERLQFCVTAGGFEFPNCYALQLPQPLAGNPSGLSVGDISVVDSDGVVITDNSLAICSDIHVSVSGVVSDSNSLYDLVSGSRFYAGDSLFSVNNSLTPVGSSTVFSDDLVIHVPAPDSDSVSYGVSVFAGSYFETDPPVRFLTVSRGSNACSVGETQCSGPNSVQYCDSTNGYGCNVWGTVSDCPSSFDPCDKAICSGGVCGFTYYDNPDGCTVNDNSGTCVNSGGNGLCKIIVSNSPYCYDKNSGSWVITTCP